MSRVRAVLGTVLSFVWLLAAAGCTQAPPPQPAAPAVSVEEIAALKAEVERLKGVAPSASVAMADVGFHIANLWFAGQAKNWPLATYYYNEGRNHIRWLIRITPTPKGPEGTPVDLKGIFDGIDTSVFAKLKETIDKKDSEHFAEAYRATLEACYQCHKAVGRPYLRLNVPKTVPQPIINLDPAATWPK
jgi:cytochrome c553